MPQIPIPQIPIYVINLEQSMDRLNRVAERLDALGLRLERVAAVYGPALEESEKREICPEPFVWYHRRRLTDPEIGTFLSHRRALERVVERALPRACILEDDVLFRPEFTAWVHPLAPIPPEAHIVKLEGTDRIAEKPALPILRHAGATLAFNPKPTMGAAAYLVTLQGARAALAALEVMRDAYDHALLEYWKSGLNVYEVCPFPVHQEQLASYLEADRFAAAKDKRANPKSFGHRLRRRLREVVIFLKKLYFWISRFGLDGFRRARLPN